MNKTVKMILMGMAVAIVVLGAVNLAQGQIKKQQERQKLQRAAELATERQRADLLLVRLEKLREVRDALVLPQVELNIRL
jgi:hypothetical protein